jgi:membrane dipeptidase
MDKIIDLHCDTIGEIQAGADILEGNPRGNIDIRRLQEGNVGCAIFACFITSVMPPTEAHREAVGLLDLINNICQLHSQYLVKVEFAEQLEKIISSDQIAVLPAVENGYAIENDLAKLENLRQLGARYMTLTHSKNLDWAASSGESSCDFEGLTPFGEMVVDAMNEMGLIVDVSHVHESTFWHAIRKSNKPIIASHSSVNSICHAARNLKDDQIKAIADSGGMIGINFYPGFINREYAEQQFVCCGDLFSLFDEIEMKFWQNPKKRADAIHDFNIDFSNRLSHVKVGYETIIDHLIYIINLVGDDHVGFGSDFDGLPAFPDGISGCDVFPALVDVMKEKNLSATTIKKVCQDNFIRVLRENE